METILILHGWGSRAANWQRVKEGLEDRGYRVLVPDLPGFGQNTAPQESWAAENYLAWVSDFCERNNLSQFVLVGHSFGGGLAVRFTSSHPEKVKRLILIGAKIRRHKTIKYYLGLALAYLGKIVFSVPGISSLQPLGRKILYHFVGTSDYYKLETEKNIIMKETFKKVVGDDLTSYLSGIKAPTLIIWGKKDFFTPLEDAYFIKREIADSELEMIENEGHSLNFKVPELLVKKIATFVK
jgi:pimeloyl-ACP methyl ester carboxylesterase